MSAAIMLRVPDEIKERTQCYIQHTLCLENPYFSNDRFAKVLAAFIWKQLSASKDDQARKIFEIFLAINTDEKINIPPIFIENCAAEPVGSFVMPRKTRRFDYGNNPSDRMKQGFVTEWTAWAYALQDGVIVQDIVAPRFAPQS